jgi:hypothetical protein
MAELTDELTELKQSVRKLTTEVNNSSDFSIVCKRYVNLLMFNTDDVIDMTDNRPLIIRSRFPSCIAAINGAEMHELVVHDAW